MDDENNDLSAEYLAAEYRIRGYANALEIISLDCASRFLNEAEFPVAERDNLQRISRDFAQKLYTHKFDTHKLVAEAFQSIEQELETTVRQEIESWIKDGYEYHRAEDDEMGNWLPLFGYLSEFYTHRSSLPLLAVNLPEAKLFSLKYAYLYCIASINRHRSWICEAEHRELSEWDKFVARNYPEGTSLLTWISLQVTFRYNRNLWQKINHLLNSGELAILLDWGIQQAKLWEMETIPSAQHLIK